MAITVTGTKEMNVAALSDVAAVFGTAQRSFATARERLASGVQAPLDAEVAWSGDGQPAALATVRLNRTGLTIGAKRMETAKVAVLGLQAALTTAQDLVRQLDQQARDRQLAVTDDGTVSVRDDIEYPPREGDEEPVEVAAVRIGVQLAGALAFAKEADSAARQLLDRVSETSARFSDYADPAAAAANREELDAATADLVVGYTLRVLWSLSKPTPILDTVHPRSGTAIGPAVGNWDVTAFVWQALAGLGSRYLPSGFSVKVEDEQSRETVEVDGAERVVFIATLDFSGTAEVSGETMKGLGGSLAIFAGRRLDYTITTDPESAEQIGSGRPVVPYDPASIPEGTSVVLDDGFYAGFDASGEYREVLRANVGYTKTETVSTGIERLDTDTVRLLVGDSELIENRIGGRVGVDDLNVSAQVDKSYEHGRIRTIDLDVSTLTGRVAYEQFLATGALPSGGTEGTSNETVTGVSDSAGGLDISGDIGPWEPTLASNSESYHTTSTINSDGSTAISTAHAEGGTERVYSAEYDPDGQLTGVSRAINLDGVDEGLLEQYLSYREGTDVDVAGDTDVTLTFDDDQLNQIREQALQSVALHQNGDDGPLTADAVEQAVVAGGDYDLAEGLRVQPDHFERSIIRAESPTEIHNALQQGSLGNQNSVLDHLQEYSAHAEQYADVHGGDVTRDEAISATASVEVSE